MKFTKEFKNLKYILDNSDKILLFAHRRPDGDTVGANLALYYYLRNKKKKVDVACFNSIPEYLQNLTSFRFKHPNTIDSTSYNSVVAIDSVERGFEKIKNSFSDKQAVVLIDHHPDITIQGDINIIDADYSSASEIVFDFFSFTNIKITSQMATLLLAGILGDTGNLQHSNTTPKVMRIAAELLNRGASTPRISGMETAGTGKYLSTFKLWGRALEKARINPKNKMISTVITQQDLKECNATYDDTGEISSILNTVPDTSFSLVLSERDNNKIKGSLRSEEYKGIDVSAIAHRFGGGGHKLASGFEIKGTIKQTPTSWEVV